MRASDLLVKCLENEGVEYIFGISGEETLDLMDSLSRSSIRFVVTRHEQGAAFMANVYGRLTGKAGVCLSTLGPGASNLLTGVADAYLDRAPLVAITGQAGRERIHKESHQYVNIVEMFRPVTKWNARVERPDVIPEVVRKAFRVAQMEKPGATHIELPEDVASEEVAGLPLPRQEISYPASNQKGVAAAVVLLSQARYPMIIAGNGVIRRNASAELKALAQKLHIPVTHTFMGLGALDAREHLALPAVGLQSRDWIMCGLDKADVVLCVGYDLVEYAPKQWNADKSKAIIHIDTLPSETDECYVPQVEIVGEIREALHALKEACTAGEKGRPHLALKEALEAELAQYRNDLSFPIKPQKAIVDLRRALADDDIVISDVGAHKLWLARMYPTYRPQTLIISNGYSAMGLAVPGAIAAKMVRPQRRVVAVSGDGAFLMTSQELETARRLGTAFVVMVWVDSGYGAIAWKQQLRFGHTFGTTFGNPDLVKYADSFGLEGFRVESAPELLPTLERALMLDKPAIVEVPIDYTENLRLTERLGHLISPI